MTRRIASGLLVVAAVTMAFLAAGWRNLGLANGPTRVPATATVELGPFRSYVRSSGTVQPLKEVIVGAEVSGRVIEVLAEANQIVSEGEILARFDDVRARANVEIARREIDLAKADNLIKATRIERMKIALGRAEATVAELLARKRMEQVNYDDVSNQLDRRRKLFEQGFSSVADLDRLQAQRAQSQAQLDALDQQVESARQEGLGVSLDVELAKAELASSVEAVRVRLAQLDLSAHDLDLLVVRSPATGTVLKRNIEPGQVVAASLATPVLFTLAENLSKVEIHANIDEVSVSRLRVGQAVTFTHPGAPERTYHGRLRLVRLSPQVLQNVVTYTAVISGENEDMALFPGMTVTVSIETEAVPDALTLPSAALRWFPDGVAARKAGENRVVQVMADGSLRSVAVTVLGQEGGRIRIAAGSLQPGDPVGVGWTGTAPPPGPSALKMQVQ